MIKTNRCVQKKIKESKVIYIGILLIFIQLYDNLLYKLLTIMLKIADNILKLKQLMFQPVILKQVKKYLAKTKLILLTKHSALIQLQNHLV